MPPAVTSVALIANPSSGSGTDPEAVAAELRRRGSRVELFEPGAADAAARSGVERLVVAGGDGSIAPAAAAASAAGLPLAVIPVGTANDFARGLELPADLPGAARLAVEGRALRALDLGRLGERPFVNAASAGLAAHATRRATGLKRLLGPLAYALGALRAGLRESPLPCEVRLDGKPFFAGDAWQVTVAGTGFFGAGSVLEPAEPDDGLLDVAVMEAGRAQASGSAGRAARPSRVRLVAHAYSLRAGRLTERRDVHHDRAREVALDVPAGSGFNVDGEVIDGGPVTATVEPRAFELVVG